MNQHELLTRLDEWSIEHHDRYTAELLRLAAVEIRRLARAENNLASLLDQINDGRGQRIRDLEAEAGL